MLNNNLTIEKIKRKSEKKAIFCKKILEKLCFDIILMRNVNLSLIRNKKKHLKERIYYGLSSFVRKPRPSGKG